MSSNDFGNLPNPYQSATPAPAGLPPAVKPVSLTVFGILNLVLGIMGLCVLAFSGVQLFVVTSQANLADPVGQEMQSNSIYYGFMVASVGLGFVATIALIVAGIGLLNGKPYGRTLSIGYALYGIISGVLGLVFNAVYLFGPLMEQANAMPDGPERLTSISVIVGGALGGVCGLIYPVILLIFMMRAPVINYMRAQRSH